MTSPDPFGLVGQILDGQYRVDALVRDGTDSVVYRGHNLGLNEPVCVKTLRAPPGAEGEAFIRRFREDGRQYCRISQTNLNLVRGITSNTTTSRTNGAIVPYLVLEWLEGSTLAAELETRRGKNALGRPFEEARSLLAGAADGLAHAHRNGATHRDLNPSNVYLVQGLGARKSKLLDFASRKPATGGAPPFSPADAAPEQFDPASPASPQVDVYAFALLFAHVLTDKVPVLASGSEAYAKAASDRTRRPTPRALGYSVSDEIETVFTKALSVTPTERQRDLSDFWSELSRALGAERGRSAKTAAATSSITASVTTPHALAGGFPRPSAPPPPMAPLGKSPSMPPLKAARASIPRTGATAVGLAPPTAPPPAPQPEDSDLEMPTRVSGAPLPLSSVTDNEIESLDSDTSLENSDSEMTAHDHEPIPSSEIPTRVSTNLHLHIPPSPLTPGAGSAIASESGLPTTRGGPGPMTPQAMPITPAAGGPPPAGGKFGRTMMGVGLPEIPRPRSEGGPVARPLHSSGNMPHTTPDPEPPQSQDLATTVGQSQKIQLGPPLPAAGAATVAHGQMANVSPNMTMPLGAQGVPSPYGPQAQAYAYPPQQGQPQQSYSPQGMQQQLQQQQQGHPPSYPQPVYPQQGQGQAPQQAQMQFQQAPTFSSGDPRFPFPTGLEEPEQQRSKKGLMIAVGAFLGLVAVVFVFALRAKFGHPDPLVRTPTSATVTATISALDIPAPTATEGTTEPTPSTIVSAPIPTETAARVEEPPPAPTATTVASTAPPSSQVAVNPGPTAVVVKPTATVKPVASAPPPVSNEPAAFNMSVARAKLNEQAGSIAGCKKGGPTGAAFASVIFGSDGSVSAVTIDAPFTGTTEGSCVAGVLRRARVPAFVGSPQLVRYHFRLPD